MTASPWLDETERRAWLGYRRLKDLLDLQVARDLAADSGLSDADYHVLSTLGEERDTDWRLRALADRLLWSPSRLSHQLRRMERRGLVVRDAATADARGPSIALTDHGVRTIEAAAPHHVRSVRRHFLDLLTREQLVALAEIAETAVGHLAPGHFDSRPGARSARK